MLIQGSFQTLLIVLTAILACTFSICKKQSKETGTHGFVTFQNIGIMSCQVKCMQHGPCVAIEYNIDSLICRLLSVKSTKAEEGVIVRRKLEADVTKGPCTFDACTQMMRCLETRSGKAACVEVPQTYLGCYNDSVEDRVLPHSFMIDTIRLTTETCRLHCHRKHYPYFGTECGIECYCGDVFRIGKRLTQETECSTPCSGDRRTMCGGAWRISIYKA